MRVLIIGAGGQLGQDLVPAFAMHGVVLGLDHHALEVTDERAVRDTIADHAPDLVVTAAAFTAVDAAEADPRGALEVNALGALYVARAARACGAGVVQISTDYVFHGAPGEMPIPPDATPGPRNVYGASKLAGEHLVRTAHPRHWIVRTQWLYGPRGGGRPNFVQTMLRLGAGGQAVSVVDDQVGAPTFTWDVAQALPDLVATCAPGTYHLANAGSCSWYGLAREIWSQTGLSPDAAPTTTEAFGAAADRPRQAVLVDGRAAVPQLRPWKEALADYVSSLPKG